MSLVEFLARAASTGSVIGLRLGVSSDEIQVALGEAGLADRRKKSLRLDYGLLEFSLFADSCELIAIQVHRLAYGTSHLIPQALLDTLPAGPATVRFEAVRREVEAYEAGSIEEVEPQAGYRCYRLAESDVILYVVDAVTTSGEPFMPGDLWSMMISRRG